MKDHLISRAEILIQQNRNEEAAQVLSELMSQEPDDIYILALYSEVSRELKNHKEAEELINSAIGLDPGVAHLFYVKAKIKIDKRDYTEAENNLKQAITINPEEAEYHALLSSLRLSRKQFSEALELADKALELEPENLLALNIRSTALLKLDQTEESFKTIEGALAEDPNNAYTHSNFGWSLLEKGDAKQALFHFREALKSDPEYQYAQAGMLEALKARYLIYRLFLRYVFFMNNLTKKYQWGVIIGFYVVFRLIRTVAESNAALQPFLTPIIVLLAIFAFSTWIMQPLSNLFFRLNKFGKHLLAKNEILSSNFTAVSFLISITGVLLWMLLGGQHWLAVAVFGFAMMLPSGVMFAPSKNKWFLPLYAAGMAGIGILAIITAFSTGELFNMWSTFFILGFVAFQWIANFIIIRESNS